MARKRYFMMEEVLSELTVIVTGNRKITIFCQMVMILSLKVAVKLC